MNFSKTFCGVTATVALTGVVSAEEVLVGDCGNCTIPSEITVDTTWTADNTYNLQNQIFVKPGATLTIEAGTVVASTPTANGSGSLAITRGAQIFVNGTQENPVIMTSTADVATWDGSVVNNGSVQELGDPTTGQWREAANEWGNLTIMGNAFISNSFVDGNTNSCNVNNMSPMEGLIPDFVGDPDTLYGGGDDDDNSGSISYLSIRYGGRVVGLANELNGLSLGGIGRGTDIDHVEIMNNVDDGIEIWGGTVSPKFVNIWNIGDDSFDIDQGWRGKAQFGLIVQGYSVDADQGSGVGDNNFETDGAEDSNAKPVTTATIYNFTVIGQPFPGSGDGGTAWRDNARVQYRKSIFMDLGEQLVRFDDVDGDGSQGYGFGCTLSWPQTWQTSYTHSFNNNCNACSNQMEIYQAQSNGRLAEIRDSIFFRNLAENAYDEAMARGVFNAGFENVMIPGTEESDSPITSLVRQIDDADNDGMPGVTRGGKIMLRVLSLDPRANNEAATSATNVPDDGFFTPADYRGGFGPNENWLCSWTAADAFGFVVNQDCVEPEECTGDIDGNDQVDGADLGQLLGNFGGTGVGDLNGDGNVDGADLGILLGGFGECP